MRGIEIEIKSRIKIMNIIGGEKSPALRLTGEGKPSFFLAFPEFRLITANTFSNYGT